MWHRQHGYTYRNIYRITFVSFLTTWNKIYTSKVHVYVQTNFNLWDFRLPKRCHWRSVYIRMRSCVTTSVLPTFEEMYSLHFMGWGVHGTSSLHSQPLKIKTLIYFETSRESIASQKTGILEVAISNPIANFPALLSNARSLFLQIFL